MLPILEFDTEAIETVIQAAELRSTGEIRVCVERKNVEDLQARAEEIFAKLNMAATPERNAILFYVHLRHKQLLVLGDRGIDEKVPQGFWQTICDAVLDCYTREEMTVGTVLGIMMAAEALARYFPCSGEKRENHLPDTVAVGEHL